MRRSAGALGILVAVAACGTVNTTPDAGLEVDGPASDGVMPDDAAEEIDAPDVEIDAPPGANALGQRCEPGVADCPPDNECVILQGVGSMTVGYCSPPCMSTDAICSEGYTGPPGGQLICAVDDGSGQPNRCVIVCVTNAECPTGLECQPVPEAGVSVCVAP